MSRFQSSLIKIVGELDLLPFNEEGTEKILLASVKKVSYELGVRYIEDGVLYLHHNDVIAIFVRLLDNAKFRMILAKDYPVVLIDEYQDTFRSVMDQFLKYFIEPGNKPQFGLFGDAWQTIYADNGACGEVTSNKLVVINKGVNFRSEEVIVSALNKIRPELPDRQRDRDRDHRCGRHHGGRLCPGDRPGNRDHDPVPLRGGGACRLRGDRHEPAPGPGPDPGGL